MAGTNYRYELRRGGKIIATGHLTMDHQLDVGDEISIGSDQGTIRTIEPLLSTRDRRIVIQIPDPTDTPRDNER